MKTQNEKWQEMIKMYKDQCKKILSISDTIRYTGVINEYGRTLTGIIKPSIKPLLKPENAKNEFFLISTLMSLRRGGTEKTIGKLDHLILEHEKVIIVMLQKAKVTFYISLNKKGSDVNKILGQVKKILKLQAGVNP